MRRIYDYECSNGHVVERFAELSDRDLPCKLCGEVSTRLVSYAGPVLDPISGDFPSATRRWALNRQQKIKAERKTAESHGLAD